jgi:HAMP domain-containing protein
VRRVFWGLVGIGIGAAVGVAAVRWVGRTKERYSPPNLARGAGAWAEDVLVRLRQAVDAGRAEMVVREAQIREELGLPRS